MFSYVEKGLFGKNKYRCTCGAVVEAKTHTGLKCPVCDEYSIRLEKLNKTEIDKQIKTIIENVKEVLQ